MDFEYCLPIRLIFGRGKLDRLGEVVSDYGRKALIVTGRNSARATGVLDRALAGLERSRIEAVIFDRVESNPLTTTIQAGAQIALAEKSDVIVGIGGGSALDAAKGIAFAAVNSGDLSEYIYGKPGVGALPIIAVTTTAGTGSEGDSLAVLTHPLTKDKKSLKSPWLYPKASIIDPELMMTLPPAVIAATGLDVLCHALEGFVSKRANPLTDAMAVKAIGWINRYLPRVYQDPSDIEAWEAVAMANTLGGMIIDSAGVALLHGLEHPVSGLLDVTHGVGLAAMLVRFMEFSYPASPEKFAEVAAVMGADVSGKTLPEAAEASIGAVRRLLDRVNLTPDLTGLGVEREMVDWLAENSEKTMRYALDNSPKVPTLQEIKELYLSCL